MSEQQKYPSPELTQRLLTAADRGDVSKIKHLLSNDELYQSLKTEQQYFDFYSRLQDDFCNQTIFHVASSSGRADVLKLLLVSSTDEEDGETFAKSIAIPREFVEVRLSLLTAVDSDNWCPLHAAVINGHLDCIRVLLTMSSNMNTNITNDDGQRKIARAMLNVKGLGGTPLEVAQQHDNNKEILSFLKSVEKNISSVDGGDESSGKSNKNNNNNHDSSTATAAVVGDQDKDKDEDEEEFSSKMVIESQRAQLLQQQMQLQQLSMMFHQLQTENRDLNILYQKEKEEHKKTKEELEKLKEGKIIDVNHLKMRDIVYYTI